MKKTLMDLSLILIFYFVVLLFGFILTYKVNASTVFTLYELRLLNHKVVLYLVSLFLFVLALFLLVSSFVKKYLEIILCMILAFTFPLLYHISSINIFFLSVCLFVLALDMILLSRDQKGKIKYVFYSLFVIFSFLSMALVPTSSLLIGLLVLGIFEKERKLLPFLVSLVVVTTVYFLVLKYYIFTVPLILGLVLFFAKDRIKYVFYPFAALMFLLILHFAWPKILLTELAWFYGIKFNLIALGIIYLFISVALFMDPEFRKNKLEISLVYLTIFSIILGSVIPYMYFVLIFTFAVLVHRLGKYVSKIGKPEYYYLVLFVMAIINIIFAKFVGLSYSKTVPVLGIPKKIKPGHIYASLLPCLGFYYYNPQYSKEVVCVYKINTSHLDEYKGNYVLLTYYYDANNTPIVDILVPQYCIKETCVYKDLVNKETYVEKYGILFKGLRKPTMVLCQGGPSTLLSNSSIGSCYIKYKGLYFVVFVSKDFNKTITPVFFGLKKDNLEPVYVNLPENISGWYVLVKVS